VWFVRSIPRTLASLAIATLFALALNPLVERVKQRRGWHRRTAAGVVMLCVAAIVATVIALVTVPTIREVRNFKDQIPHTVKDLGTFKPAGDDMGFAAVVTVPLGTPPGTAVVRDDQQATFRFEVGRVRGLVDAGR